MLLVKCLLLTCLLTYHWCKMIRFLKRLFGIEQEFIFLPNPYRIHYEGKRLSDYPVDIQTTVLRKVGLDRIEAFLRCGGVITVEDWKRMDAVEWELFKQAKTNLENDAHILDAIAAGNYEYANRRMEQKEGRVTTAWAKAVADEFLELVASDSEE